MNKENLKEFSGPNFNEKIRTRCSCIKKKADFYRPCGSNPQKEYSTCNKCYEKRKNTREKKKKLEDDLNEPIPQINTNSSRTPFFQLTNLELLDDIMEDDDNNVNEYNGEGTRNNFQAVSRCRRLEILAFEIELDSRLVECIFPEFQPNWHRPENLPVKRRSEARTPINRYACMGNIILTIDPQQQRILVNVKIIIFD
ncbi:hypothetical protein C1646_771959 [Rhizophagus diaphanus]|nr:hypothetical protein C1646_771959 [Rhizophagus diaphanus] [Rhizophagus sp. MUCL 43196]